MAQQDGGIFDEVSGRHGQSQQPESKQLMAVLNALRDVISAEGLTLSPTSYFAAAMSALEKPETKSSAQVTLAICTLLSYVLPRVPNAVIRAKWVGATSLVTATLKEHADQAPLVKAAIGILSQMLSAMDPEPSAWPAAAGPWATLLSFVTDTRAKVRKRAMGGVVEVLAALQPHPHALSSASDALAKLCTAILAGPEAAAIVAAAASNKTRAAAEERIAQAVADALHLLGALKTALPLTSAAATKTIVDLVFKLYPLRQPLLNRHATDVLGALTASPASHLSPGTLSELLTVVMEAGDSLWDRKDTDVMMQLTRLLEGGVIALTQRDAQLGAARLPRVFHALVPQLAAAQDSVQQATSAALRHLIEACVTPDLVTAALTAVKAGGPAGRAAQPPLVSCIAAVAGSLSARYQDGWALAVPVAGELLDTIGQHARSEGKVTAPAALAGLCAPLLTALAALVAGEEEGAAADTQATAAPQASGQVAEAASQALRSLGPAVVLRVLPLLIQEQLEGRTVGEPRTWLLPIMRRHVCGAPLAYWCTELLPLARALAARSAQAAGSNQAAVAQSCHVLELQIWACLPAFISWAPDLPATFANASKELAAAFNSRDDLQGWVCAALERATTQVRQVLRGSPAHHHLLGPAEPLGSHTHDTIDAEGDNDDGEYGTARTKAHSVASTRRGSGPGGHPIKDGGEHHLTPPVWYGVKEAEGAVGALRSVAKNWLATLCKAFIASPAESRGNIARAISCYASVSDAATVSALFKTAVTRLLKVMSDAAADLPPPDMITDGGSTPSERRASFTELALCLASGLPDEGLETLLKVARPSLSETKDAALQKKGYKVLAYLCEARPSFLRSHLAEILTLVISGSGSALSAAKRYRLRCIKPLVLALAGPTPLPLDQLPSVPGVTSGRSGAGGESEMSDSDDEMSEGGVRGGDADTRRREIMSVLVSELMLCCKEANGKTRQSAYQLLVQIAHAMDELDPLPPSDTHAYDAMDETETETATMPKGGLGTLFSMIVAGLAGQTPHMISASVMALARLLYEFAGQLRPMVPQLLPAVLLLFRTRSREVVKSVLGFVKVCAIRMPVDVLTPQLGPLLEGMLLWASDSKNKFKQKVRVVVERLAKRCGFEEVAKHIPESDARLLTHIRKEHNRKQRLKHGGSQAGSDIDSQADGDDAKSHRSGTSRGAKTARTGDWAHSQIFSDDEGNDSDMEDMPARGRSVRGPGTVGGKTAGRRGGAAAGGVRIHEGGVSDDPMDLLDVSASRQLMRAAANARKGANKADTKDDYTRNPEGKMIIEDEDAKARARALKRKRRGDDNFDSDDSDYEDLRGVAGLDAAVRDANKSAAVRRAVAAGTGSVGGHTVKTQGGKSQGDKSRGGQTTASKKQGPSLHSGERFKAKSTSGGDVKGRSKVEPYAYWQFDRKMLNRRPAKKRVASNTLTGVLAGAAKGAMRGAKARGRANAKRARSE